MWPNRIFQMNEFKFAANIVQDDVFVTAGEIANTSDQIAEKIRHLSTKRLAVATARVDLVIAALAACQREGCQLLLLRRPLAVAFNYPDELGVDGCLTENGAVEYCGQTESARDGFAILLSTSGTTGIPKFARHSLEKLCGRIRGPKPGQPLPTWLLSYHPASFAGLQVVLSCLVGESKIVSITQGTVPQMCEAARKYSVTHLSATPTFWRAFLLAMSDSKGLPPLQQITLGGEVADQTLLTKLRNLFPQAGITHIYASTEAGALFAVRDGKAGFPAGWLDTGIDGVSLRLRKGVLEVKSPRAMSSYLHSTNNSPFSEDGWLITNDLVEVAGDRVLFRGRSDLVLNIGGAKVTPEEIEAVLLEHPDVAEAVVYGIANPITGATVAADIQCRPNLDEASLRKSLLQYAKSRLESYKIPRIIRFNHDTGTSDGGKKSRHIT